MNESLPPHDRYSIPSAASGAWPYNATPDGQATITSHGEWQFVALIDSRRHPVVLRRRHGAAEWTSFDLADLEGNPIAAPIEPDGHNYCALFVDAAGYVHYTGNHHVSPLKYVRGNVPMTIRSWESPLMPMGSDEVTYPRFTATPDGGVLLWYRHGVPGNGRLVVHRHDPARLVWGPPHTVVDGEPDSRSFYPNRILADGSTIHLFGVWRSDPSVDSTHDLTYARSDDLGMTWMRVDGSTQQTPITWSNCDVVIRTISRGSGVINNGGLALDAHGNPHAALLMMDELGRTQVHHIFHDSRRWHCRSLTDFCGATATCGGYFDGSISHPSVVATVDGRILVLFRITQAMGPQGLWSVDATPGSSIIRTHLLGGDLGAWNPTYDEVSVRERNQLQVLVVPTDNPHFPSQQPSDRDAVDPFVAAWSFDAIVS